MPMKHNFMRGYRLCTGVLGAWFRVVKKNENNSCNFCLKVNEARGVLKESNIYW